VTGRGTTDTSVLHFNAAPATGDFGVPLADWVTQDNAATTGTSFIITLQGTYIVDLLVASNSAAPGDSPVIGISIDATGAVLTSAPVMALFPSIQGGAAEQDASLPSGLFCSAPIYVPAEEIVANRNRIRLHVTPTSPIVNAFCTVVIRRVGDATIPT